MKKVLFFLAVILCHEASGVFSSKNPSIILLSTSKFWFNYRSEVNLLNIYHYMRQNGISDDQILLMLPENNGCNPRNIEPGCVGAYDGKNLNRNVEKDYKQLDVNVRNLLNILRGRYDQDMPFTKRIKHDKYSKMLFYASGHGGNTYMKMQDTHVVYNYEIAIMIRELALKNGYKELLLINDSCEALTLFEEVDSPNVFSIASSIKGIRSYASGFDGIMQLSRLDKFSEFTYKYLENHGKTGSVQHYFELLKSSDFGHEVGKLNTNSKKTEKDVLMKDFFTNQQKSKTSGYLFESEEESPELYKELSLLDETFKDTAIDVTIKQSKDRMFENYKPYDNFRDVTQIVMRKKVNQTAPGEQ